MCVATKDMRLEEVFDLSHISTTSRSCTTGGCPPDVVVEFRPNKSAYGTFGFDWVRVEDSFLNLPESDIKFSKNVGKHYSVAVDSRGIARKVYCIKDTCVAVNEDNFDIDMSMVNRLESTFSTQGNINTFNIPSLKNDFQYKIPVITLMPNNKYKNPSNINRVAKLDVKVYMGKKKSKSLRLRFSDGKAAKLAFSFNTTNIPNKTTTAHLTITSIGTLYSDLMVYVHTDTNHICGAFKLLRNNGVKDINVIYIGTRVNAKNPRKVKEKRPPVINIAALRSRLAQALINIKEVKKTIEIFNPRIGTMQTQELMLDMRGQFRWITAQVNNPKYDSTKPIGRKNSLFIPDKGLDFDNIMGQLESTYQSTYGAFPLDTFRCYFLADKAVSVRFKLVAGGGGTPGMPRSMFFGDGGSDIGVLAHELGHNLSLKHTFTQDASYSYKKDSTDNIMDYNHKDMSFYYWQWKIMNPGGF